MKTQIEMLTGTDIPTDELPAVTFSDREQDFLTVAEGFVSAEWGRVCGVVGLKSTVEVVPPNYDQALEIQGRWDGDYPKSTSL